MRLDDIKESDNIEDRRGQGGGGMFGGGGGMFGGGARMGRGRMGFGTIIVLTLLGWLFGINPSILIGGADILSGFGGGSSTQQVSPQRTKAAEEPMQRFVAKVLATTEDVWSRELPAQKRMQYEKPPLVLFSGITRSGCGTAQSAMGPFYCPADRRVYLDMSFFEEMRTKLGATGDFAQAYVIAHEVGHHIENMLGILPKVQELQSQLSRKEGNALSVRVELMADCLAGVWARHSAQNIKLDQGDLEEALNAATAIGDDRLQKQSQGYAVPDSFTHGSSQQRVGWFTKGLKSGKIDQCDTFNTRDLNAF